MYSGLSHAECCQSFLFVFTFSKITLRSKKKLLRIHLQDFFFQKGWEKNIGINWAWKGKGEWRRKAILLAGRRSPGKISIRRTYRERHPFRKWLFLHMLGHLALPVTTPVWAGDKCAFTDSLHTHTHTQTTDSATSSYWECKHRLACIECPKRIF